MFAYAEELGTKEYLVALACDEVAMPESGGLSLYGLRAEVTFYKSTLDLLKLQGGRAQDGRLQERRRAVHHATR